MLDEYTLGIEYANDLWLERIDNVVNLEAYEQMNKLSPDEKPNWRDQDAWMIGFDKAVEIILEVLND